MESTTYTNLRANLAGYMDKINQDHSVLLVTRANSDSVVVMSLADYEAINETFYLLKNPKNAARLQESIDEIEAMIAANNQKNQ